MNQVSVRCSIIKAADFASVVVIVPIFQVGQRIHPAPLIHTYFVRCPSFLERLRADAASFISVGRKSPETFCARNTSTAKYSQNYVRQNLASSHRKTLVLSCTDHPENALTKIRTSFLLPFLVSTFLCQAMIDL